MVGSYAVYVDAQSIHVWEYCVNVSEPDGEWTFIETLDCDGEPRLSLAYAALAAPDPDGYWIYSGSYDCELDCE